MLRTISIEFESRSNRFTRAMTSLRSSTRSACGWPSQPSLWNKIFSDVAMPAHDGKSNPGLKASA